MSITGSLSTMPLADLLSWVGATNRLGVLTVHGVGSETMLHLRDGRVVECAVVDPAARLGQFLLFHGIIDEDALDRAMRLHKAQGQRLGEVLLQMGAVTAEELTEALAAKADETVLGSFDHATGWFTFDPNLVELEAPQELDMPIADAIARGVKRAENAAAAAAVLKRSGVVLHRTSKAPSAKLSSVWPLRSAYALVDGERGIDEIALHMHGTESQVLQRLHQLYAEGFIEVVERAEPVSSIGVDTADDIHDLSVVEKYLLTLCDGTRDLQRITAVAPVQSQIVVDTIRSLNERGWLKAMPAGDH